MTTNYSNNYEKCMWSLHKTAKLNNLFVQNIFDRSLLNSNPNYALEHIQTYFLQRIIQFFTVHINQTCYQKTQKKVNHWHHDLSTATNNNIQYYTKYINYTC